MVSGFRGAVRVRLNISVVTAASVPSAMKIWSSRRWRSARVVARSSFNCNRRELALPGAELRRLFDICDRSGKQKLETENAREPAPRLRTFD